MALDFTTMSVPGSVGWSSTDSIPINNVSFVGDSSYPTGGYADFKATLERVIARSIEAVVAVVGFGTGGGVRYDLAYDAAAAKLKVYVGTTGVEAANATDLSGVTFTNITVVVR